MNSKSDKIEIWGGLECSINRINDQFYDQLDYSGHYDRPDDIKSFIELGIKKIRYPVLWEKHKADKDDKINWLNTETILNELRDAGIDVIAGLIHHGSGPAYVNMLENSYAEGLADYAAAVAEKFPWITYYTPVNEPVTTARFCGLYGLWHPHKADNNSFCRILINECKATVLAMQAIRRINPAARLIQTDDLGKVHSTTLLAYQADFENHRRWLSFDLLCGRVSCSHPLYNYLSGSGITNDELAFFQNNPCVPDLLGFNHYLTSERYLDENLASYPVHTHGGNGQHSYADVEAVRVGHICPDGPYRLLIEAWERYRLPLAVTEVHLYCTREEQMRWLSQAWDTANRLKNEGVEIYAITAWALLGSFGWNRLLTQPNGDYEPGVFDLTHNLLRPTALAAMIKCYNRNQQFNHPVTKDNGWWQRQCRVIYCNSDIPKEDTDQGATRPILITGKTGTLGNAFARICNWRGLAYKLVGRDELDITNRASAENSISAVNPWAIINTAGFARVEDAETESGSCFAVNTFGPQNLAAICEIAGIKLLTFSTDLVFNGLQTHPYLEYDKISPINVYGRSKALAEQVVLQTNPSALMIRTSAFFGPWDNNNFIKVAIDALRAEKHFAVANDVVISPTYIPDLVNTSLNLLLDDEQGIWHLSNNGQISWSDLAFSVAGRLGFKTGTIKPLPVSRLGFKAKRPLYSVLNSVNGTLMPTLSDAIDRCLAEIGQPV